MANKKTRVLTEDEYKVIIDTCRKGFVTRDGRHIKANIRIAVALTLQANLGLRIGDIVDLRLSDIIKDGGRYRLNIKEQKTNKSRIFTVPSEVYTYLQGYALEMQIKPTEVLFSLTVRAIQKHLALITDYLGLQDIGTHSFRKFFAMSIYNNNDYNVELVRVLLQHSSVAVTQHYLSVQPKLVEDALAKHIALPA